jgi:hypothetical protein
MGNISSHPALPAPAAWSDSQLDVCLDRLGTCESTVRDQEVEIDLLQLALKALAHPWAIVGMAITIAILGLVEICRQLWHICHGNLEGAFPLDRVLGWILRRLWRVLRYPFVLLAERLFGRRAAEEVRDRLDQLAVSPVQADPPPRPGGCGCGQPFHQHSASASSTLRRHRLSHGPGGASGKEDCCRDPDLSCQHRPPASSPG